MIKFTVDFLRLLENIHSIRDRIIWLPLCADDTEESLYEELCSYVKEYEFNIQNPPSETKKKK